MTTEDRSLSAAGPFDLRAAMMILSLVVLAAWLKLSYHGDHAEREPLADVPYGDSVIYLDEAARIWGGGSSADGRSANGHSFGGSSANERVRGVSGGESSGSAVFYKPPLYTVLLDRFSGSTAEGQKWLRLLQLSMSVLVLVMVFLMARVRAGDVPAAAATLLLLLYAPITFHETKLLDSIPGLFFAVAGCFLLDVALRRAKGPGPLLLIGLVFGLAALTRSANLLLAAAFIPFCPSLRGLGGLSLLLGAVLVVTPVAIHNQSEGAGGFVPVNYSEGHTFLVGNNENSRGMYTLPPGYPDGVVNERLVEKQVAAQALGRDPSPAEQRDHSYGLGVDYLREHPERIAGLLIDKLRFAISSYEVDDNYSLERERDRFGLLTFFITPFSLLLALGLAGVLLPGFRGRSIVVLPILLTFGLLLAFYVASRYRLIAAPFLAVGAAVGFRTFLRGTGVVRAIQIVIVAVVLGLPWWLDLPYARAQLDRAAATFDQVLDIHASDGLIRQGQYERAASTLAAGIADRTPDEDVRFLTGRLQQLLNGVPPEDRNRCAEAARAAAPGDAVVERAVTP